MPTFAPAWAVWGGNNAFFFDGRCIAGPSLLPPLVTGGAVLLSGIVVAAVIAADLSSSPSLLIALTILSSLLAIVSLALLHTSDPGVLPRAPLLIAYANSKGKARENYALAALSARLHLKNIVAALMPYLRLVVPLPQADVGAGNGRDGDDGGGKVRSYVPARYQGQGRRHAQRHGRDRGRGRGNGSGTESDEATYTDSASESNVGHTHRGGARRAAPQNRHQRKQHQIAAYGKDNTKARSAAGDKMGVEKDEDEGEKVEAPMLTVPSILTATEAVVGPRAPVWSLQLVAALGEGIVPPLRYTVPRELADRGGDGDGNRNGVSAAAGVKIDYSGVLERSSAEMGVAEVIAGGVASARWCWQCHIPHPRLTTGHCGVCGVCIEHWDQRTCFINPFYCMNYSFAT